MAVAIVVPMVFGMVVAMVVVMVVAMVVVMVVAMVLAMVVAMVLVMVVVMLIVIVPYQSVHNSGTIVTHAQLSPTPGTTGYGPVHYGRTAASIAV